jgi:hypothetical protein
MVEARTAEWRAPADLVRELLVGISVSRADDGSPVTGLGTENFRVAAQFSRMADFAVDQATEWRWEPDDVELSGCYELQIGWKLYADIFGPGRQPPSGDRFVKEWRYVLGIQARTFDKHMPPRVVDQGQTLIELISEGV